MAIIPNRLAPMKKKVVAVVEPTPVVVDPTPAPVVPDLIDPADLEPAPEPKVVPVTKKRPYISGTKKKTKK